MNVSVGQIENLTDAVNSLSTSNESLESAAQQQLQIIESKVSEAEMVVQESQSLLEIARAVEAQKVAALLMAEARLAEAVASAAELGPLAAPAIAEAAEAVRIAVQELEEAKEHRMRLENRLEIAQRAHNDISTLEESVRTESGARLREVSTRLDTGRSRLTKAREALNEYHATNPAAANFNSWLKWSPEKNSVITPAELDSRLNISPEQQKLFAKYLEERDPDFRAKLESYRAELSKCSGEAERHAVLLKIRKNLSGDYSEKLVKYALSPLAENTNTQLRTDLADGIYTKTDLVLDKVKLPVILGRGEGKSIQPGGQLAIEVKSGKAEYLYRQLDHMVFQSGGHRSASNAITICTHDINDLDAEKAIKLREALAVAGSPMFGALPSKDEIDKVCWKAVLNQYN